MQILEPAYAWFEEGGNTRDQRLARALVENLRRASTLQK
jgi:hypothetical protein